MSNVKNFNSNEECATALYKQLVLIGEIDINDDYYTENSILHDINNLRGYEWLQCLQRNIDTEPFFAYLDPEYVPHFYGDGAVLEDTFIFDISIAPGEYWRLATGENDVVIDSLETLRNMMDDAGLGEVWDYSMGDIDEAMENNEHLVLVEEGELSDYPANNCRVFEVTDEMFERFQELYGQNSNWDVMHVKYPEPREDMSEERERQFVQDCFYLMELEGFSDKFWSPFGDYKDRFGEKFKVVERCTEKHCDLEVLPMWNIQFTDGTVIGAYPEEIIPSEMKEHGCPYFNEPSLSQMVEEASRRSARMGSSKENKEDFVKE